MWRMCRGSPQQRARLGGLLKFGGGGPMPLGGSPHDRSFMTTSDHPGVVPALDAETIINALAAMPDVAIMLLDVDLRITGVYGGAVEPRGYDPVKITGQLFADVFAPLWDTYGPLFKRALAGETVRVEGRSLDDQAIYDTTIAPMYRDGELTGVVTRSRDVTAERQAQAQLTDTAQAFRAMAETSLEGHCRHRPDGTIFWASPAMETLLGYPLDHLVGLPGGAIVVDEDRPIRDDAYRRLRDERRPCPSRLASSAPTARTAGWE